MGAERGATSDTSSRLLRPRVVDRVYHRYLLIASKLIPKTASIVCRRRFHAHKKTTCGVMRIARTALPVTLVESSMARLLGL